MSISTLPLRAQTLSEVLSSESSFRLSRPAATGRIRALAREALVCPSTSAAAGHLQQRRGAVWEASGCMWWFPNESNTVSVLHLLGGDKCIQKTEQQDYWRKVKCFRRRCRRWVQGAGAGGGQRGLRKEAAGRGGRGSRRAAAGAKKALALEPQAALFYEVFLCILFPAFRMLPHAGVSQTA